MRAVLDLATGIFAFLAAAFWFQASGTLPPMLAYWDAVPSTDPYRQAVELSAHLNAIAAFSSGCAALCACVRAGFDWWAGPATLHRWLTAVKSVKHAPRGRESSAPRSKRSKMCRPEVSLKFCLKKLASNLAHQTPATYDGPKQPNSVEYNIIGAWGD